MSKYNSEFEDDPHQFRKADVWLVIILRSKIIPFIFS